MTNAKINHDANTSEYFERMASSVGDKVRLLRHMKGGVVADVGAGGGEFAFALARLSNVSEVHIFDASSEAINRINEHWAEVTWDEGNSTIAEKIHTHERLMGETDASFDGLKFDTIFCSSVLHEVYSYLGEARLKAFCEDMARSLNPGGRIIIRDGVRDENRLLPSIRTWVYENGELLKKYFAEHPSDSITRKSHYEYEGPSDLIAEAFYTVIWGEESFPREVEEFYTFARKCYYPKLFKGFGLKSLYTEPYFQEGYRQNYEQFTLHCLDNYGNKISWEPYSNCVWVFEKPAR